LRKLKPLAPGADIFLDIDLWGRRGATMVEGLAKATPTHVGLFRHWFV